VKETALFLQRQTMEQGQEIGAQDAAAALGLMSSKGVQPRNPGEGMSTSTRCLVYREPPARASEGKSEGFPHQIAYVVVFGMTAPPQYDMFCDFAAAAAPNRAALRMHVIPAGRCVGPDATGPPLAGTWMGVAWSPDPHGRFVWFHALEAARALSRMVIDQHLFSQHSFILVSQV
jgi:hypothetical protein